MSVIRSELEFLEELDDAFLVPFPGIPCAHGPSIPSRCEQTAFPFVGGTSAGLVFILAFREPT